MRSRFVNLLAGVWLPLVLVAAWWCASAGSTSLFFPPLHDIVRSLADAWLGTYFTTDILPSLLHFVSGFIIAVVVGSVCGVMLGLVPRVQRDLTPITEFSRALPIAALIPPALLIIGAGPTMEVTLIAFGCVWPILINAADGVRSVDPVALETAQIYGLTRRQRAARIVLPFVLPAIFAGMRISVSIGLAIMVLATMIGTTTGMGYAISRAQQQFDLPAVWAGVIVAAAVGVAANLLLSGAQRLALGWYVGWRAATGD